MGSFTEVTIFLDFRSDVPDDVLAAFSALAVEQDDAPAVPGPVVDPDPFWEPEMHTTYGTEPPLEQPWLHDWARIAILAQGPGVAHGTLTWDHDHWHLDCRFSRKSEPWTVNETLEWLAPFVDTGWQGRTLVGVATFDGGPRPFLLWVEDGRWELEDLNPADHWD